MIQRYVLDTNTVSHLLRQQPQVVTRVMAVPVQALCISAVTEGELLFGLGSLSERPEAQSLHLAVRELLRRVESVAWGNAAAAHYGPLRAQLQKQGKSLDALDLMIASHALSLGATLVTNDQAFTQVSGLVAEDWTQQSAAPVQH